MVEQLGVAVATPAAILKAFVVQQEQHPELFY